MLRSHGALLHDGDDDKARGIHKWTLADVAGKNAFNQDDPVPKEEMKHETKLHGNMHGRNFVPHRHHKKPDHLRPVATLAADEGASPDEEKEVNEAKAEENEEDKDEEKKEGEEGEEEEQEPWNMEFWDKVFMEVGWLGGYILLVILLILFMSTVSTLRDQSKDVDDGMVEPSSLSCGAYWFHVHVMDPLVVILGLANFVVFAANTELLYDDEAVTGFGFRRKLKTWVPRAGGIVQNTGAAVLLLSLMLRLISAPAHPWWKSYRSLAPLVGVLLNLYAWIDVVAVVPSLMDWAYKRDEFYNIQFICLMRLVEMAVRTPSSTGAGIRAFIDVFDEDGALISTIFALGLVVWIFFSGLYMVANRSNPESVWEAAEYKGEAWQRFESIPSSMFFTLLNLCKEHPLADVFGAEGNPYGMAFFQRAIIIVVCIVGVPVFGVPTGILGASLMKHCKKEVERMKALKLLPEEEGETSAPVQASSPLRDFETEHHGACLAATMAISFGSTFAYFFYTYGEETRLAFIPIPEVTGTTWAGVDLATSVIFLGEFVVRAFCNGRSYFSVYMLIDLLSWAPGLLSSIFFLTKGSAAAWLQGLCVLRVLKPERYMGAFAAMITILSENGAILKATALTSFLLWLVVSSLLHFTERHNPDEELQETYASVPRALWAEIVNLHGEWPWCDYTWQGKAIGTFLNFVSIGICMVPVVVFSDAFMSKVEQEHPAKGRAPALQDTAGTPDMAAPPTPELEEAPVAPPEVFRIGDMAAHRWQLQFQENAGFGLLYSHLLPEKQLRRSPPNLYYLLRYMSTCFILFGTFNTVTNSLPSLQLEACEKGSQWKHCEQMNQFFLGADIVLTVCFLAEFLMRIVVLRGRYLICFIGLVDLLSLLAFLQTLTPRTHDLGLHPDFKLKGWGQVWVDLVLPCRLMRLMMLESWSPAIQSLCDVVWIRAPALRRACYALVAVWYMFTVCLYVLEKDSGGEVGERFENVLVGLPHGLIHLTGDYPCTEYRSISMPFHLVFLILGMCCTGTFTGIFAGGFVEYLGAQRQLERQQARDERLRVMAMVVSVLQRRFRLRRQRREQITEEGPKKSQLTMGKAARRILRRQTSLGLVFMTLAQVALAVNVFNTMLESIPEVEAIGPEVRFSLTVVEIVTGTIFCVEFLLHVVAKPSGAFTTPMRIIDFVCLLPTILRIYFQCQSVKQQNLNPGFEAFIECVAACRVVRVLDWPQIRREVLAVKQTLKAAMTFLGHASCDFLAALGLDGRYFRLAGEFLCSGW